MNKNPTLERVYDMLVSNRDLRLRLIKSQFQFNHISKRRIRKMAKRVHDKVAP